MKKTIAERNQESWQQILLIFRLAYIIGKYCPDAPETDEVFSELGIAKPR